MDKIYKTSRVYKFVSVSFVVLCLFGFKSRHSFDHAGKSKKQHPFFVYNFGGLEKYAPEQQVELVSNIGYDGMVIYATTAAEVEMIPRFMASSNKQEKFKIYAVFVRYNFSEPEADRNRWKEVLKKVAGKDINLWVIFGEKKPGVTDETIDKVLKEIVDEATVSHVPVTLYPHSSCYIESAEQALPFVKRVNSSNLKLAVHLCHEVRAGNASRINEVVKNVEGYISYATVAGTDSVADHSSLLRMDTTSIKPLDRGNYDVRKFLQALKSVKYKGPIGFINFKIKEEPTDYLTRSLNAWKKMNMDVFNKSSKQ